MTRIGSLPPLIVALVLLAVGAGSPMVAHAQATPKLPEAARGVSIPRDKGYYLEGLGEGLYWVTDGFYTTMFATTGQGVIVVDAPPSLGDKLLKAIKEVTSEPVAYVIYSHSHADHIGAAHLFPKGAVIVAHQQTQARLRRMADPKRAFPYGVFVGGAPVPLPTVVFEHKYTLKVGNQVLRLEYRGDDHEPGNIYIYAPNQKVLLKIDIVFPGWSPFEGLAIAEDALGYLRAMDEILSYDFTRLVSGHWSRLATRQDVEVQRQYLRDIVMSAGAALKAVTFSEIAAKLGTEDVNVLMDTYLKAVTQKCAEGVSAQWRERLGGVEAFTGSHCHQIMMALRVD